MTLDDTTININDEETSIDNSFLNFSVIYPSKEVDKNLGEVVEKNLLVVFPDGDIDASIDVTNNNFTTERPRRVVVRKRLRKKIFEPLHASESKLVEQIDDDLDTANTNSFAKAAKSNLDLLSDEESAATEQAKVIDDKTAADNKNKRRRKKTRQRAKNSTVSSTTARSRSRKVSTTTVTTTKQPSKKAEAIDSEPEVDIEKLSAMKQNRKHLYDTKSRTNFLKRTNSSSQNEVNSSTLEPEFDENASPLPETTTITESISTSSPPPTTSETTHSHSSPTTETQIVHTTDDITTELKTTSVETFPIEWFWTESTTAATSTVVPPTKVSHKVFHKTLQQDKIDSDHKQMIQTLYKALSAIHSGVEMKKVEKFIEQHRNKMELKQKRHRSTTPKSSHRGNVKFRMPERSEVNTSINNVKTTQKTPLTTGRITRKKSARIEPTRSTTQRSRPDKNSPDFDDEELNMPPKKKMPGKFKPAQFYGITMSKSTQMDNDEMEKIHKTFQLPNDLQNGFFPVIENGTPSILL